MDDVRSLIRAIEVFVDHLESVAWGPLLIAVGFHVLNLLLRTRAWWRILRAAYPEATGYRWRSCAGAYLAGVGINAIVPARAGDLVKIYLVRIRLPGSSAATIVATLLVETLFDSFVGPALLLYAYYLGVLPSVPDLPSLPAFEWSWAVAYPRWTLVIVGVILVAALLLMRHAIRVARDFWARVRQGFTILWTPRRYLRYVVALQALGWCCRVASIIFFLRAFSVDGTLRNALLVLVVGAAATLLPATPGGVGTTQALTVVVLAGEATRTAILSFSVGMQIVVVLTNVVVGFTSLALMMRSFSFRRALADARAAEAALTEADRARAPS